MRDPMKQPTMLVCGAASLAALLAILLAVPARGDTLELKNGQILHGQYVGGTATTLRFETAEGVRVIQTSETLALTFGTAAAAHAAPPAAVAAPAAAAAGPVTVPAGSVLTVIMDTQVSSKDAAGKKFAGKLAADLTAGATVVAKAGTTVYGQVEQVKQAGRMIGKSEMQLTLTGLTMDGSIQPIMTTNYAESGKSSGRKTARNTAAGAGIGALAGGGEGAKTGAAVGLGVSVIRQGDTVTVPPGAVLEFRLSQPFAATITR